MVADSKISFRSAKPDDYPALIDIRTLSIKEGAKNFYTKEEIDQWVADGHYDHFTAKLAAAHVFVSEVNGSIIGFASWRGNEVDQVYIHPAYFGRGIGARLLLMVEGDYTAITSHSTIYVGASNNARAFYERQGFRFIEHRLTPKNTQYSYLEKNLISGILKF